MEHSPRAVHELQQSFAQVRLTNNRNTPVDHDDFHLHDDFDDYPEYDDSDSDNGSTSAAPPPIPSRRSTLSHLESPPREPRSAFNPLRSHPVASSPTTDPNPRHRFSHPLRQQQEAWRQQQEAKRRQQELLRQQEEAYLEEEEALRQKQEILRQQQETLRQHREALRQRQEALQQPDPAPQLPDPSPRRHPSKLQSYRSANSRLHPRLRQRTSLETIASVTTAPSLYDFSEVETPSSELFNLEDETSGPPPSVDTNTASTSHASSVRSTSISSARSSSTATRSIESTETQPSRSLFHKLKLNERSHSDKTAERLVIERKVSIGRTSQLSILSSPAPTSSSSRPSSTGYPTSETAHSQSSSEWKASEHDISNLSAEELKKCKKKGINPALYAEMKAAKKGKWMSPIAGNTLLS
jgi:hypothetical protein